MSDTFEGFSATFKIDGKIVEIKHGDEIPKGLPKEVYREVVRQSDEARQAQIGDQLAVPPRQPDPEPPKDPAADVAGIPAYDDLGVKDVVELVTAENALAVKEYEEQNKDRSTVIKACDAAIEAATNPPS